MSWLSNLFSGGKNPASAAQPYYNQIPGIAQQYMQPYVQQGQQAYQNMQPQLQQMSQNPTEYLNQLLSQYKPSEAYQNSRDEAMRAAGNTAAAGGMRGSSQDSMGEGRLVDSLMGQDMQQWLQNVRGLQTEGLQGQSGIYGTGANAGQSLENDLQNSLAQQGNLAFYGQAQKNANQSDLFKGLTGGIGGLMGMGMGGGNTLGGNMLSGMGSLLNKYKYL